MAQLSQDNRRLAVTTPLGKDVLLLAGFSGQEELSRPFVYHLELLSERADIVPRDIVGKPVGWSVNRVHGAPRFFHGYVRRFVAGTRSARGLRSYRAEVVPWLWFLTRTSDCRIFQGRSTPEIVQAVFDERGFNDYALALRDTYPKREYCVQYRETAFDFLSRLLEEEGIYYFFRHEEGRHTLILGDRASVFQDCPDSPVELAAAREAPNRITSWEHGYEFRSGQWAQADYYFEAPSSNLRTTTSTVNDMPGAARYEQFDYPGLYRNAKAGNILTKRRMEEEETHLDVVEGAGPCCTFTAGGKFQLQNHPCPEENQAYVVTSIRHSATEASYEVGGGGGASYQNTFTCIPARVEFRPARTTRKPAISGLQTAVVVGPVLEEVYCDKHGRVKVQFHWDRRGGLDENSSCWVRVAQVWAGKGWGAFFWPRRGHEVVVSFEEGDPDRPLIIGSVYNAENRPPFHPPDHALINGFKSCTHRKVANQYFNGILLVDEADKEHVAIHSERFLTFYAELDKVFKAGRHQDESVPDTRLVTVGNLPASGGGSGGGPTDSTTTSTTADPNATTTTADPNATTTTAAPAATDLTWSSTDVVFSGVGQTGTGINETMVFGENVTGVGGSNLTMSLGANMTTVINPLGALAGQFPVLRGFSAAGLGGNMQFVLGTNNAIQWGANFTVTLGGEAKTLAGHLLVCRIIAGIAAILYSLWIIIYGAEDKTNNRKKLHVAMSVLIDLVWMAFMQAAAFDEAAEAGVRTSIETFFAPVPGWFTRAATWVRAQRAVAAAPAAAAIP